MGKLWLVSIQREGAYIHIPHALIWRSNNTSKAYLRWMTGWYDAPQWMANWPFCNHLLLPDVLQRGEHNRPVARIESIALTNPNDETLAQDNTEYTYLYATRENNQHAVDAEGDGGDDDKELTDDGSDANCDDELPRKTRLIDWASNEASNA